MKTKSILYGFHDEDLESDIKRMLQTQGYQVVSVVKYGLSSIVQYASDNPIDAVIMRCKTNQEFENNAYSVGYCWNARNTRNGRGT